MLEDKKNKLISKIRTSKNITRRARNGGTETLDFEFKYNPNVEVFYKRFFAKLFDFLIYYYLINLVIEYFNYSKDFTFFISFFSMFIISPFFESFFGRTIGKFIFGLQVIDDNCKFPNILKSFTRNLLQLFNILFWFIVYSPPFDMYYHNEKTKTYTIYSSKKNEIKKLMENP